MRPFHRLRTWLPCVAPLLLPTLAWAAEAGARSPVYDLVMKFVNFGILAGILFYFLRKPISQGLADRQADIRKALEEARQAKEAAEAKHREYTQAVANLQQEIEQLQKDFKAEGERQRDRILEDARRASDTIRQQAEAAGQNEVVKARSALQTEATDIAVRLAEQLLAKAYTPEDQKKAVQTTIKSVEKRVH